MYEDFPFWFTFFTLLGYEVVLSGKSSAQLYCKGMSTIPVSYTHLKANFTLVEIDSLSDIQADKHMYATINNLLADAYYAQNLGYKPFDIEYIELASKLNIGCADINKANIINLIDNTVTCDNNSKLASHINASNPCEQCYQNLLQALSLLDKDNLLDKLPTKLFIGQGWREFSENGIGIGLSLIHI